MITFKITDQKTIKLAECDSVPRIMIIFGQNGIGKSTLLHAVKQNIMEDVMRDENVIFISPQKEYARADVHRDEASSRITSVLSRSLIDVKPREKSSYIRSSTEPFDDEMIFDEIRAKRWLAHFRLLTNEKTQWHRTHVSGHGSGDQIKKIIEGSAAKTVVPIHTEHEEYHKKWHNNVAEVNLNSSIELS
jgi:hypothetical protein